MSVSKYDEIDFGEIFYYDETSPSCLRWKISPAYHVKAGDIAGSACAINLRWDVLFKRKHYLAHRIVWYLNHGKISDRLVINHINCDSLDNRIYNLELCTTKDNNQRTRLITQGELSVRNTTGVNGVHMLTCFNKDKTKQYKYYVGCVTIDNKLKRKLFSIEKYGEDKALLLASQWRNTEINCLIKNGYISLTNKE